MRRLNATVAASLALTDAAIAAHATTTTSDSPAEASFGDSLPPVTASATSSRDHPSMRARWRFRSCDVVVRSPAPFVSGTPSDSDGLTSGAPYSTCRSMMRLTFVCELPLSAARSRSDTRAR
jgi:hypothetical protein